MHIYIHTGIYQHVSVPRCPSTLQNCFAFHELLGPNYKSFHNFCSFPSATFPPTSWIFKKSKIWDTGKNSGTLPFSRHISVGSRTLPVGYPSIRAVVSVPYAWSWRPCWRSMRTDGRRPAICWIIRSSEDKHGAPWVLHFYRGKMMGRFQTEKKRHVSKWRSWKLLPVFLGGLNQTWYKCRGSFWDISLARNCLGLAIYSDPCWRVKGCNQTGEPTCCQVWPTLKLKCNWKNCKISRWWFQTVLIFTRKTWKRFSFWRAYFSDGLKQGNHQPHISGFFAKGVSLLEGFQKDMMLRWFLKVESLILRHPHS